MFSKKTSFSVLALLAAAIFSFFSCSNAAGNSDSNDGNWKTVTNIEQVYGRWVYSESQSPRLPNGTITTLSVTQTIELPVPYNSAPAMESKTYADLADAVRKIAVNNHSSENDAWNRLKNTYQNQLGGKVDTLAFDDYAYTMTAFEYTALSYITPSDLALISINENGKTGKWIQTDINGNKVERIYTKQ